MSFASRSARFVSQSRVVLRPTRAVRCLATAAEASTSSAVSPAVDPKISRLVDDISGLTLLQAADLVSLLKARLNIQEIAMPVAAAAPAANAAAASDDAPAEAEKPKEKTTFDVTLVSFDATAKAKIIKEVKSIMPNMNLMEAKKFVESVPKPLKEGIPKEEAEKLQKLLKDLGAVVNIE